MTQPTYQRCKKETCRRPMRPRGYTVAMAPDTVAMGHKGMCKSCVQPRREPKERTGRRPVARPEESVRIAHMVRGLEAFYARRYARGVPPEAMPAIAYDRIPAPARIATVTELRPAGPAIEYRRPVQEHQAA